MIGVGCACLVLQLSGRRISEIFWTSHLVAHREVELLRVPVLDVYAWHTDRGLWFRFICLLEGLCYRGGLCFEGSMEEIEERESELGLGGQEPWWWR